ncbi:MAG: hypothetical protein ACR2LL_08685 [Nitrosopumilus sp.]
MTKKTIHRQITKEEVMKSILSKECLDWHGTQNGFSMCYGIDEIDLPTDFFHMGETDMIEECLNEIIDFYITKSRNGTS